MVITRAHKITTLAVVLLVTPVVAEAWTQSSLNGSAEVSYVNFSAEANGRNVFSGNTLAQKYSLDWSSTNLYYRAQPRYYIVNLGYDWTSFNTRINDNNSTSDLSRTFGKFRYNGEVSYSPDGQPIRFKAYANNGESTRFQNNGYLGLIDDGLTYRIEGLVRGYAAGFSFVLDSDQSATAAIRQLPRMYVDYRVSANKAVDTDVNLDSKTTELSIAGLNKENNWLKYRNIKYENFRNTLDNYEQQQMQIGLVDQLGRRKWAALTNWINVSADGSFTNTKGSGSNNYSEAYDVNFHAIATRRNWQARTFMNYNRELQFDKITEKTRVPFYLKGNYSPETEWYANVAADRGRELKISGDVNRAYVNSVTLGATMFKRSSFTLAPSFALTTSKAFTGNDEYNLNLGVSSSSTRYFSSKASLYAGYLLKYLDNGSGTADSTSWSNNVTLKADYMPTSQFAVTFREDVEYGRGSGYLNKETLNNQLLLQSSQETYMHFTTSANVRYAASSAWSTSLEGTHEYLQVGSGQASNIYRVMHNINYNKDDLLASLSSKYDRNDISTLINSTGQLQYRPNRYHDALARFSYDKSTINNITSSEMKVVQKYNHNLFTKTGALRNYATLSEEFSFTRTGVNSTFTTSKYLLLSGRYSPLARTSLYGSVKYQSDPGAVTMFYNAGAVVDFKLLSTSLDYTLAKRDSDHRTERRISASVKRVF